MLTTVLSSKGQVIDPKALRSAQRWGPGTQLKVLETAEGILLRPVAPKAEVHLARGLTAVRSRMGYGGPAAGLAEMGAGVHGSEREAQALASRAAGVLESLASPAEGRNSDLVVGVGTEQRAVEQESARAADTTRLAALSRCPEPRRVCRRALLVMAGGQQQLASGARHVVPPGHDTVDARVSASCARLGPWSKSKRSRPLQMLRAGLNRRLRERPTTTLRHMWAAEPRVPLRASAWGINTAGKRPMMLCLVRCMTRYRDGHCLATTGPRREDSACCEACKLRNACSMPVDSAALPWR
jgi:AbrB family looped-hinge helix DNA binding protein